MTGRPGLRCRKAHLIIMETTKILNFNSINYIYDIPLLHSLYLFLKICFKK
jgi:hypothetical protein